MLSCRICAQSRLSGRKNIALRNRAAHAFTGEALVRSIAKQLALCWLSAALCIAATDAQAQTAYQRPPKEVLDVLDAPANPALLSISPAKDRLLLATWARHLSIAELAEPVLPLAGL